MNAAQRRLEEHPAWPMTPFQLECEMAGVYQNVSGHGLSILQDNDEIGRKQIDLDGEPRTYFTRFEDPLPDPEEEIVKATREFEAFLTHSGYFANLATYVALCKIHDELNNYLRGFDVLPEGPHPYILNNTNREPDAVVRLAHEHIPVEVYNGGDLLGTNTKKHEQLQDLSSDPPGGIPANPMLVNRRSDDNLKNEVRHMDGIVVDTDTILACENKRPEVDDAIQTLRLQRLVDFIPEVQTSDGIILDGNDYDALSIDSDDVEIVRPPSKLVDAADDLPAQFLKRVRGGVQLQYVNSIYREGHQSTAQDACFVLQAIYNLLLREGGHDRATAS